MTPPIPHNSWQPADGNLWQLLALTRLAYGGYSGGAALAKPEEKAIVTTLAPVVRAASGTADQRGRSPGQI